MGTITLKVRELAEQKGVENPFALARATGLGYAVCHRMWNGETTLIALETLAKLCDGLKIKPSQLIEYTPDE
jgi:DNA-binding Xre family transcriptional regulator